MQAGSRASLREKGRATNKERLSQRNCGCDEPLCWFVIYCLKRLRTTAAQVGMLLNLRNNHITDSKQSISSPSFVLSFLNALALYIKSDRAGWCIAVLGCIWMYLKGVHISMHSLCETIMPPYAFHALCDDLPRDLFLPTSYITIQIPLSLHKQKTFSDFHNYLMLYLCTTANVIISKNVRKNREKYEKQVRLRARRNCEAYRWKASVHSVKRRWWPSCSALCWAFWAG